MTGGAVQFDQTGGGGDADGFALNPQGLGQGLLDPFGSENGARSEQPKGVASHPRHIDLWAKALGQSNGERLKHLIAKAMIERQGNGGKVIEVEQRQRHVRLARLLFDELNKVIAVGKPGEWIKVGQLVEPVVQQNVFEPHRDIGAEDLQQIAIHLAGLVRHGEKGRHAF